MFTILLYRNVNDNVRLSSMSALELYNRLPFWIALNYDVAWIKMIDNYIRIGELAEMAIDESEYDNYYTYHN